MPAERYQINFERLVKNLPEGFELVSASPNEIIIRRTQELVVGPSNGREQGRLNDKHPSLLESLRRNFNDVQLVSHNLTICIGPNGKPDFSIHLASPGYDTDVWRNNADTYLRNAFKVERRDSNQLKVVIPPYVYYYFEVIGGELVVSEIR